MKCRNCGSEMEPTATQCPVCGCVQEADAQDAETLSETPSKNESQTPDEEEEVAEDEAVAESVAGDGAKETTEETPSDVEENNESSATDDESGEELAGDNTEDEQKIVYRWNYEEQAAADVIAEKNRKHTGIRTYAVVMTACFAVSFLILIASLLTGGLTNKGNGENSGIAGEKVIYVREGEICDDDTLTTNEISALGKPSVVAISIKTVMGSGVGTGIIMSEDGYIATNYHVIENANTIRVQLYDGTMYEGRVIGSSEIDDLAVVKIDAKGLTPAKFGDSSDVLVGDRVVVIGHPAGLEFGWTTTQGIISAINRAVKIKDNSGTLTKKMTLLQTDANVNSGNSGGPMFNASGEVIGIISMKLTNGYEGMGFAIPINGAMTLLNAIIEKGSVEGVESEVSSGRPVLGIIGVGVQKDVYYVLLEDSIRALTEAEAAVTAGSFRAIASGVLVTDVSAGLDAEGKVQAGDIIVGMNGQIITTFDDLREALYDCNVGDVVSISFVRDGETKKADIKLSAAQE